MNSALYNDSYCIGLDELNKIYVSLLTSSDNVFINANTSINPSLSAKIQLHIKESIEDLEKAGLITYWCFPHDKDNHSHLNGNLVVLDRNEYDMWNSTINMHFFSGKRLESIFDAIGNHSFAPMCEDTSRILLIRKEYWSYATMTMLHASKLVNFFASWMPNEIKIKASDPIKLEDLVIDRLFYKEATSFSLLKGTDIINFNKKNAKLRKRINESSASQSTNIVDQLLAGAVEANAELVAASSSDMAIQAANTTLLIGGYLANLTPAGLLLNILKDSISSGGGLVSAIKSLYKDDKNLIYLLCRAKSKAESLKASSLAP